MRFSLLLPLLGAIFLFIWLLRQRSKRDGSILDPSLLPALLLIAWFAGLQIGQWTSSLSLMSWSALFCLALCGALVMRARSVDSREASARRSKWSFGDWACCIFLAVVILTHNGNDNFCHYSLVGTYLRGNIPPCALNDPASPLPYHPLFDAAAALVAGATGFDPELSLDVVSIACILVVLEGLHGASRMIFLDPRAQAISRVFFLFGLGPTYLRWARTLRWESLHGTSTQSFAEAISRRPMALNFVIIVLLLGLLPELTRKARQGGRKPSTVQALVLIPVAFVLPAASEELPLLATMVVLLLLSLRRLHFVHGLAWMIGLALALPLSGSFRTFLHRSDAVSFPVAHLALSLNLPSWGHPAGIPLLSRAGVGTLFYEWGPVFAAGLWLAFLRIPLARAALIPLIGLTLVLPFLVEVSGWPRADLDRFYFYGTALGFFLVASWVQAQMPRQVRGGRSGAGGIALCFLLIVSVILGPVAYLSARGIHPDESLEGSLRRSIADQAPRLRRELAIVGSQEQITTKAEMAQELVLAGFIVEAPMTSNFVGRVDPQNFDAYVERRGGRGEWLFLPESDPRVLGREPVARVGSYVLVASVNTETERRGQKQAP